jgi:DNA polymerase III alpha subunit
MVERMKINPFGEVILNEFDIVQGLYSGKIKPNTQINVDDPVLLKKFNDSIDKNADQLAKLNFYQEPSCSINDYDSANQQQWFIPDDYKELDIARWLLDQCESEQQYSRVIEELELYVQHDMIDVLICIKYLVDFMREHNIVWGVGRGSSVASYCLYLIGLHKVDSIKYRLDIKEFLKE